MIDEYNNIIDKLDEPEAYLLKDYIYKAETAIQSGLGRTVWLSLNIREYSRKCTKVGHLHTFVLIQILTNKKNELFLGNQKFILNG